MPRCEGLARVEVHSHLRLEGTQKTTSSGKHLKCEAFLA